MRSLFCLAVYLGLIWLWTTILHGFRRGIALTWLVFVVAGSGIATHALTARYHEQLSTLREALAMLSIPLAGMGLVVSTFYLSAVAVKTLFERDA